MRIVFVDTIESSFGKDYEMTGELPKPKKVVSPWVSPFANDKKNDLKNIVFFNY